MGGRATRAPSRRDDLGRDARAAAALLREGAAGKPVPLATAEHLEAIAVYWLMWLPAEPTPQDRTAIAMVRSVLEHYAPASSAPSLPSSSD